MTRPMIELDGLTVRFGSRTILHGLTARLDGRCVGLLGPNGAGKSTLILSLLGLCPVTKGTAKVLGLRIDRQIRQLRSMLGYMPENESYIADMTAVTFVRMMAELSGLPAELALERAHEALFYVGLGEARYRKLGTYSQGMRQMAKLAQAIVHGPRLLILDEPTNGLDPASRTRMIQLIQQIRDSGQVRILLCSHLLADVEQLCDQVLILKAGRIVHLADLNREHADDRRFVEMEVPGGPDGLADAIAATGCSCKAVGDGRFSMELPDGFDLARIYQVLAQEGLPVRTFSYRKDTLEQVFMRAMEQDGSL